MAVDTVHVNLGEMTVEDARMIVITLTKQAAHYQEMATPQVKAEMPEMVEIIERKADFLRDKANTIKRAIDEKTKPQPYTDMRDAHAVNPSQYPVSGDQYIGPYGMGPNQWDR